MSSESLVTSKDEEKQIPVIDINNNIGESNDGELMPKKKPDVTLEEKVIPAEKTVAAEPVTKEESKDGEKWANLIIKTSIIRMLIYWKGILLKQGRLYLPEFLILALLSREN